MGLSINTGMLADLKIHDPEGASWLATSFDKLNRLLAKHALPAHVEPEAVAPMPYRGACLSFPYAYLHRLRRALAFARQDPAAFGPAPADWDPNTDPLLESELFVFMDAHLICHSDCEGFYVPIDFADPLYAEKQGEVSGGIVGSTQRLLQELISVAPLLGIRLDEDRLSDAEAKLIASDDTEQHPLGIERLVWFALYEAAAHSLAQRTAIVFQ